MDNERYALLVVDMQNGFCHPDGSFPRIGRGLEGAMDAVANAAIAVGLAVSTRLAALDPSNAQWRDDLQRVRQRLDGLEDASERCR